MQINGISNGMNAATIGAQRGIDLEEAREIKNGTTEEGAKMRQAFKTTEQARGLGSRIDVQA